METCLCSFLIKIKFSIIMLHGADYIILCMCHSRMCIDEWHPTASTLCLLGLPRRKVQVVCLSYAQNKAQKHHPPENSLATGGSFECNIYLIMALDWLKKERKKINNSDFWLFQVCHVKMDIAIHYYCRLGQAL